MPPAAQRAVFATLLALGLASMASAQPILRDPPPLVTDSPTPVHDPDFPPRLSSNSDPLDERSPSPEARIVFFPPTAPIFGAAITELLSARPTFARPTRPADELADQVNEFFYPALGTRLSEGKFTSNLLKPFDAYCAARTGLLNELQAKLALLPLNDAAARERELREFAAIQTPRVVALEKDAERLRKNLVHDGSFGYDVDWNESRKWRLDDPHFRASSLAAIAEFQVIRAAVFYQTGLTPEQRGLLLELAIEQREKLLAERSRGAPPPHDPFLIFFSPETSRLKLPSPLPPALGASVEAYNHDKEMLKRELHDTVLDQDKSPPSQRTKHFEALADRQWPHLRELAERAEEVRRGLSALPEPPLPPLPPQLPPALLARIEAYRHERTALDRERQEFLAAVPSPQAMAAPHSAGDIRALRQIFEQRSQMMRDKLAEFQRENAPRYEALQQSLTSIGADITAFAQSHTDPATGQPMDAKVLLRQIGESNQQFAKIGREAAIYPLYRTAMLEPGLSPEQRRLLFGAALVGLAQPLPNGEPMPIGMIPRVQY
jgi:hypothetical protein